MGAGTGRSTRTMLFVVLVFAAVARTAVVGSVGGDGGGAGTEDAERFLRLWTDGGGEAVDDLLEGDEEDDDMQEDDDEQILMWGRGPGRSPTARNVVNVDSFGVAGDGNADDTEAFLSAWKMACSLDNAVFLVPGGRRYKVGASKFMGPCKERMIIQIQGTIVAPEEPSEWDPRSPRLWLLFSGLADARIQGGGVIDGSGSKWWANSCKINKSNPCKPAPTAVTIDSCRGVRVRSLRVQNAQQMHFTVSRSRDVRVAGVRIEAPEDSPNTDGIHVAESTAVTIQSCRIATGDDCISVVNGSFNIRMKNIDCGPGHGISIGSLGKDNTFAAVENVALDTARISRAQNGVRIKTWQGGAGYVRNVLFSNVVVDDVDHPIIIDQFYCDSRNPCHNQTSNVKVSKVVYRHIRGTSRRAEAIKFACSDAVPCSEIVLSDINLLLGDGGGGGAGEVQAVCNCAMGFNDGRVFPAADCLRSSTCGGAPDDHTDEDDDQGKVETKETTILHTEL
ncbi:probable polygalacturonase At1g80170 [Phragmites australis]|uniref:probable polygalacturonase At1g80170 n=1 Tax=Phragmites australis TaxID=29695 RepID=UPI002D765053|nr:probable polygalacturonase At1g80170 [Phragmites australis]